MTIHHKTIKVDKKIPITVTCNKCNKTYSFEGDDVYESQEFLHINFQAGYGSIFGDGCQVKGDFCQSCLKNAFGDFLDVYLKSLNDI